MAIVTNSNTQMHQFIGRTLLEEHLISKKQLESALTVQAEAGTRTVETLILLGYLDPAAFGNMIATRAAHMPMQPDRYFLPDEHCDLLPHAVAERHTAFPLGRLGQSVLLATSEPLDKQALDDIERTTLSSALAVHCNSEAVSSAIALCYPESRGKGSTTRQALARRIELSLKMQITVNTLATIETLPTLPETLSRVMNVSHDPHSSARDIADVVETDPPIAARLLQLTNSPVYGVPNRIDDVLQAVTLLGIRETYLAVLSAAVLNITENAAGFDYKGYWRNASFTAAAARTLAQACGHGGLNAAFTAGLLADIGRFTLSQVVPSPYRIIHQGLPHVHLITAEEDLLGIAHPEAGYILATHWNLPADLVEAIRFHHRPSFAMEHHRTVNIVALASVMAEANECKVEPDPEFFAQYQRLLAALKLDAKGATAAYKKVLNLDQDEGVA